MTDLEMFLKECEALGRRRDNGRGKDKTARKNSAEAIVTSKKKKAAAVKKTKTEIEAINARILMENLGVETLCWKCINARDNLKHSCEKFQTGMPCAGSKYTEEQGELGTEYNIRVCPCFKFEYDRPQLLNDVIDIIAYWCEVSPRTIKRNPEKWVELYNHKCPSCAIEIMEDEDFGDLEDEDEAAENEEEKTND